MAAADDPLQYIEPPTGKVMQPTAASAGVDDALMSVSAAQIPPKESPAATALPAAEKPIPAVTSVPRGTNGIVPAGAPSAATAAQEQSQLNVAGPVTPALVIQAGLPKEEAADWAALANWMTAGEAHDFGQLYGTEKFTDFSAHPADKGWSGGVGPDGRPTHPAGLFQDQPDTWHKIAQTYGLRDFGATSQVSGNLRYATDLYKQRTGRSLLADFKAGNTASISSVLHDQWPSLGGGGGSAGGSSGADPAFDKYRQIQQAGIDRLSVQIDKLAEAASREPPGSDERHEMLRRAMEHSELLAKRYEKLSEAPPKPMSPFEAAGEMTPLLIGLITLAGTFTRQPALGAINALGSALGALKQGNDENYKNAVDLWSKQTDHAAKAFGMQNEEIDVILRDRQISEKERQDKLQNAFRVLGLQRDLELAKGNMWETVYKRQDDRKKLQADLDEKKALTAEHFARAKQLNMGGTNPFMVTLNSKLTSLGHDPSAAEYDKAVEDTLAETKVKGIAPGSDADLTEHALAAEAKRRNMSVKELSEKLPDVYEEVANKALARRAEAIAGGRAAGAPAATYVRAIEAQMSAEKRARGEDGKLTEAEHTKALQEGATFTHRQTGLTGNLRAHIQDEQLQYAEGLNTINEIMELLDKHGAIAGLGGKLLRGVELAQNIVGVGSADYYDFMRKIEMLQNWANSLLQQKAAGRMLSAQENRIMDIVPGIGLGQPAARVYPAMLDLQKIFSDMFMLRDQQLKGQVPVFTPPIAAGGTGVLGTPQPGTSTAPRPSSNAAAPPPGVMTTVAPGLSDLYPEAR